jgi:hypothetical protein
MLINTRCSFFVLRRSPVSHSPMAPPRNGMSSRCPTWVCRHQTKPPLASCDVPNQPCSCFKLFDSCGHTCRQQQKRQCHMSLQTLETINETPLVRLRCLPCRQRRLRGLVTWLLDNCMPRLLRVFIRAAHVKAGTRTPEQLLPSTRSFMETSLDDL